MSDVPTRVYSAMADAVIRQFDELARPASAAALALPTEARASHKRLDYALAFAASLAEHERAMLAGHLPPELRYEPPTPAALLDALAHVAAGQTARDEALADKLAAFAAERAAELRARSELACEALAHFRAEGALERLVERLGRRVLPLALLDWLPIVLPALDAGGRVRLMDALHEERAPVLYATAYDLAARVLSKGAFRALEHALASSRAASAA